MRSAQVIARPRTLSSSEVDQLDPYAFFAVLGKRVIHPGGRTATDALIRRGGFAADQAILDVGCGVGTTAIRMCRDFGLRVTAVDIAPLMLELYTAAGLADIVVETGPFDMMTPAGFLHDEGLLNSVAVVGRALSRLSYARKMAWLMPRVARAVPYLGFILVCGTRPPADTEQSI